MSQERAGRGRPGIPKVTGRTADPRTLLLVSGVLGVALRFVPPRIVAFPRLKITSVAVPRLTAKLPGVNGGQS
jgi:hypothetical protein